MQVCNHPDLFEGRPIVSAFDMPGLVAQLPSRALRALEAGPFARVDAAALGLRLEFGERMSAWEAQTVQVRRGILPWPERCCRVLPAGGYPTLWPVYQIMLLQAIYLSVGCLCQSILPSRLCLLDGTGHKGSGNRLISSCCQANVVVCAGGGSNIFLIVDLRLLPLAPARALLEELSFMFDLKTSLGKAAAGASLRAIEELCASYLCFLHPESCVGHCRRWLRPTPC